MRRLPHPTGRTVAIFGLALIASLAFAIVAREIRVPAADQLDVEIEMWVHRTMDSRPADVWAYFASFVGSNWILLIVVGFLATLSFRRRRYAATVVLVIDAAIVMLGDLALKHVFARQRPHLFDKLAIPTDYSFPSGHSMGAVGIWGVIAAVLVVLYARHKTVIVLSAILLILSIGWSRIYFGVHWPSDVVGGFLAGTPPLLVSVHLLHSPRREVAAP